MKKFYKNLIILFFFSIVIVFVLSTKVDASNSISKITMDVYINSNGNAEVTEIWNANLNQGTEGYKPYSNLGNSKITNFTVSDDTGKNYTSLSSWNTNGSLSEKAYKCGINKTLNGVELCWGISDYGFRTYTLKYIITDFVNQYEDSQGVYFSLMPKEMEQTPSSVVITIYSDTPFTKNNSQIWAFGYKRGSIDFSGGKIIMNSNRTLSSSSYMTALIKIDDGTFNTSNKVSKTFNEIYEDAMSDVDESEKKSTSSSFSIFTLLIFLFSSIIFNPIVWIILIFIFVFKGKNISNSQLSFGADGKNLPNKNSVDYFRDIPCNKDLYRAYWIIYQYDIESSDNCKSGLFGAIILDWIKNGYVNISKTKKGLFSLKDNNYAIDLNHFQTGRNQLESNLLEILKDASGENGILEAKEFEKWCKKEYYRIDAWFNKAIKYETDQLKKEGMITETLEEKKLLFGLIRKTVTQHVDPSMKNEAINLLGLRKFLLDYSMISNREAIEVHLWEEYLIFAQLLGIADKVEEQFSKLYPDFNQISNLNTEYSTIYARQMVYIGMKAVQQGRDQAERRSSRSYSSGSGGSSHSSGGSSASGSSSGGRI